MIRGFFNPKILDWPVPMVRAALYLPGRTESWCLLDFLLDTGAGTTCVYPADAVRRLGLDSLALADDQAWDRPERHRGVGGGAVYYVNPARYALLTDRGDWQFIEGTLRVAQPTPTNWSLPSILGWDILRRFAISLDWEQRVVELR